MASKYVRYFGIQYADIVLYTARTLTKLEKRVLIIDYTEERTILSMMPQIPEIDITKDILNYRDINYTCTLPEDDVLNLFHVIFVLYGHKEEVTEHIQFENDSCYIVTTQMPHEVLQVKELIKNLEKDKFSYIIRSVYDRTRINEVKEYLGCKEIAQDKIRCFDYDYHDIFQLYYCQTRKSSKFSTISPGFKNFLMEHIKEIFPDTNFHMIKKAYKSAEKGVK